MKRIAKSFICLLAVLVLPARAALDIVITEGVDAARPIAVVPFVWQGTGPAPESISDVVMSDLTRSVPSNHWMNCHWVSAPSARWTNSMPQPGKMFLPKPW